MPENKVWHLPHFVIVNPNKKKLRIVFDASAKSNGLSLNDFLVTGPDLYNSLQTILLNFRIKRITFTSDIKDMFLQVGVRPEDRRAQRFLWRGMDRNRSPDTYEIQVAFFGSTSGPTIAQEAKNRNAREFSDKYPEAVKAILEDHYMDDYLGCADSEEEAVKLIHEVIFIHAKGGFNICGWNSNSKEILQGINSQLIDANDKNMNLSEATSERILGLWWNPVKDTFTFKTNFFKVKSEVINL